MKHHHPDFMNAAVFTGVNQIEVKKVETPKVIPGSLLLQVQSCAICGSDIRILKNGNDRVQTPRILGHETAGVVVEVGAGVDKFKPGDFVAVGADVPCGKCTHCLEGRPNCCDTNLAMGYQFDGSFAEYVRLDPIVVSLGPVHKFRQDLNFELAALAEPLACCINGYERVFVTADRSVAVFGAGPIGIMLAMLADSYKSKSVFIFDPNEARLKFARKLNSNWHCVNTSQVDPVKFVKDKTGGVGADIVFTACPAVEAHEQAIAMVAKRGFVNLFGGLPKSMWPLSFLSNDIHYKEAYITGSHGSTPAQHLQALKMIESGKINLTPLLSSRFGLKDIDIAFKTAMSGTELKVIVRPNG